MAADHTFKFIVIGDTWVGKTWLARALCEGASSKWAPATIYCDFQYYRGTYEDSTYRCVFWDTAGSEQFMSFPSSYFRGAHACVVVYALDSAESYESMKKWVAEMRKLSPEDVVGVVVGNKADLIEEHPELRAIDEAIARNFAASIGFQYFEASAKTGQGVATALTAPVAELITREKGMLVVSSGEVAPPAQRTETVQPDGQPLGEKGLVPYLLVTAMTGLGVVPALSASVQLLEEPRGEEDRGKKKCAC